MAGAYPDPPAYRFAWHEDGTQVFNLTTSVQLTPTECLTLNREAGDITVTSDGVVMIFPEHRNLSAIWLNGLSGETVQTLVSTDTSNGVDGTWVAGPVFTVVPDGANPLGPSWRSSPSSLTALFVKAIRFKVKGLRNIHLYGELVDTENTQRIEFWHPEYDQKPPANWFDWGNCPRQSTGQTSFRLKNMDPALTANDVSLSMRALTDTVPSVPAQHLLSKDGIHWYATIDVGDIAPNGLSPVAYLRRITPSNAVLNPPRWAFTIRPNPAFWS